MNYYLIHAEYDPDSVLEEFEATEEHYNFERTHPKKTSIKEFKFFSDVKELGHILENSLNVILWHKDIIQCLKQLNPDSIQFIKATIYNRKKQVLSRDYKVINNLNTFDILDPKRAKFKEVKGTAIKRYRIKKFVPDFHLAQGVPMFQMLEWEYSRYPFISEELCHAILQKKPEKTQVYDVTVKDWLDHPIYG